MKLLSWIKISGLSITKVAKLFRVTHAHIYKYLYYKVIPRPDVMERIFLATEGMVSANDFYDTTPEVLEKKLLEQAKLKETTNKDNLV